MSDINQLISIIIPVFNESESIGFLLNEVISVMETHKLNFELIVVNDGSKDDTHQVLKQLTIKVKELSVICLRKNYGQTAAMAADDPEGNLDRSSLAKLTATEAATRVVDRCVQSMGRWGLIRGSKIEKYYRQARPMRVYEGASEVLRLGIASRLVKELGDGT